MSILNISSRALVANQTALQTIGNNIANVNSPGYSRQNVVLEPSPGQFTGSGYVGKGVDIITVLRNVDEFLIRQSTTSSAVAAYDQLRADKLAQLQDVFAGGANGLGSAINEFVNSFSDVANAPTDLTARAIVLTRADEAAGRFNTAATRIAELSRGVNLAIDDQVTAINSLALRIGETNELIARATGTGQPPNTLLDQRDQLIRDLNRYLQTTQIDNDDGSVSVFIGGSQALVLGSSAASVVRIGDPSYPGDGDRSKLAVLRGNTSVLVEESNLGGGETSALLRFQNTDLTEGKSLLGRLAVGLATVVNDQHRLGLDLDGNTGNNLFADPVLTPPLSGATNTAGATLSLAIADATALAASEYEVRFTNGTDGTVVRLSDNTVTNFSGSPITIDGLSFTFAGVSAADQFLVKPFSSAASRIDTAFSSPRQLAIASPIEPVVPITNTGTLTVESLTVAPGFTNPTAGTPVTLTFTSANSYTLSNSASAVPGDGVYAFTPGQAITIDGWTIDFKGNAAAGDVINIQQATAGYRARNAGNADALLALRDLATFDGASLSDGYAGAMSQIGIRVQSAQFATDISKSIAANLERDRSAVSGVNLDEEAARLLQYQQAYQASGKMLQVAQTIFDTLISTFR